VTDNRKGAPHAASRRLRAVAAVTQVAAGHFDWMDTEACFDVAR